MMNYLVFILINAGEAPNQAVDLFISEVSYMRAREHDAVQHTVASNMELRVCQGGFDNIMICHLQYRDD